MPFGITGQSSSTNSTTNTQIDNSEDNRQTAANVQADTGANVISAGGGSVTVNNAPENLNFAQGIFDTAFRGIGEVATAASKVGQSGSSIGGGAPIVLPAAVGGGTVPKWAIAVGGVATLGILFLLLRKK